MSVVQTLLATLQNSELKELCSIAGYKSQLDELQGTVDYIKAVLQDAEQKQVLSNQEQLYIENLKDVVDEADNLFDEFVTVAQRGKHFKDGISTRLLSVFSKYGLAYKMSQKAKKIKAKLDKIAYNKQFSFKHKPVPIRKIDRETCSYQREEIIGRENDLEAVMETLLDPNIESNVSFLGIVGIGGLGKTALAQQVFNDSRVRSAFSLRKWICVSDEKDLDVKDVLCKILSLNKEGSTLDEVQRDIQTELGRNRYLLVLDDVWTENRDQWRNLTGYLMEGQKGSWIVVTTRSLKMARLLDHCRLHKLSGLSPENSWRLLKRKAFGSEESSPSEDFEKIGQVIVQRCAYVPLAIRVVGSLLYGQDKRQWQSFQEHGLANINEEDDVMPILKMSYYQLSSPLKSCFSYCALFTKDERIFKRRLIRLWIAQGYITSRGLTSLEEVAEDYVLILIDRGFFQDVGVSGYDTNEVITFKIHDLMHDVAEEVVQKEICRVGSFNGNEDHKVRHISLVRDEHAKFSVTSKSHVRSFIQCGSSWYIPRTVVNQVCVDALLANWKYLRTLDLSTLNIRSLPGSIGNLLHLRYLDVSENEDLEVLPRQITRLYNLQVLNLLDCIRLKELPKHTSKLVKLKVLDNRLCNSLTRMPRGIGELACLHTLGRFSVDEASSSKELLDAMEDLKGLVNLKGELEIYFPPTQKVADFEKDNGREGGYLVDKQHLDVVRFYFNDAKIESFRGFEYLEAVMEESQPHHKLKGLEIDSYQGARLPAWARGDNLIAFLPNLVNVCLAYCNELKTLECLGNLRHLRVLELYKLLNLEYIIEKSKTGGSSNTTTIFGVAPSSTQGFPFFPSLEALWLQSLPKLKGWERDNDKLRCLPHLKTLGITNCPSLVASLQCPLLEDLILCRFNKRLQIVTGRVMNTELGYIKGKGEEASISITDVEWLTSLSIGINREKEVEGFGEVFHICLSSLQRLKICRCENLTRISTRLDHLEDLRISSCPKLSLSLVREEGCDMPWPSFGQSLHTLELDDLPQVVNLPNWIQYSTTLQELKIISCEQLVSLPSWMSKLTSLEELIIYGCSATLKERCQGSLGEDWPHISHIRSICIS